MNLSELAIRRPVFITCLVILLLTVGLISLKKLPVDLFPNVNFSVISITTSYPGTSPEEVETSVSKVLENELNNIPGIKTLRSDSSEGRSQVVIEFTSETDIKYAEQQVRDRISAAKKDLPKDINEPTIKRMDPADKPIAILALKSPLPKIQLYDLAENTIKPKLEQINQVGMAETLGSDGKEIQVNLDRNKLAEHGISADQVVTRLAASGENIPVGKVDQGKKEKMFRSLGEYKSVKDIGQTVVSFLGNDIPVRVDDLGKVSEAVADEQSKTYLNGQDSLTMMIYRQTGTNTVEVVDKISAKLASINAEFKSRHMPVEIKMVRDGSKLILSNIKDVEESIFIGILLTIAVVYLFLGSIRSTFITGLALPTSLIGSFLLMRLAGFSINTMSLLALSLAVGLLVDDAIVVRENIFRHGEKGKLPRRAAIEGTKEVLLAVIATTLTVIAVFGPIGFLHGVVGGFFKEFGLTVCFAMLISLFDALTIAPMLSAYIGLGSRGEKPNIIVKASLNFQTWLAESYGKLLKYILRRPLAALAAAFFIFAASIFAAKYVPKTFVPPQDTGEFIIALELPPGANLQAMDEITRKVDKKLQTRPEIATRVAIVGSRGEPSKAQFFINLVPSAERSVSTFEFKTQIRKLLKSSFHGVKIVVKDVDLVGGGQRPFNLVLKGDNLEELKAFSFQVYDKLKGNKGFLDPEISYKAGKPELRIVPDRNQMQKLGVSATTLGQELRVQVEGTKAAIFSENGNDYNVMVRLQKDQRDLEKNFSKTLIPNMNSSLVRLADAAKPIQSLAPATISRQDRVRYIEISADIAPDGPGMGGVTQQVRDLFENQMKLPPGISYSFNGQAESFKELTDNMIIAVSLGVLFIYLVLASLYESFIIPFTIMLVLPLATCGAIYALLITQHALDIFSMIGCILLFGIATKNSILLVDYTRQLTAQGLPMDQAIIKAGVTRLRPILMTTIALIFGMLPIAIGLNEASKQRTSMGIGVIGGLISSTLLTLIVIPAAYAYIERFRLWCKALIKWRRHPEEVQELEEDSLTIP
jgi:hydrophobic/amphiphilic exporter-1 (mainly G- bacteria), HAE1 family